MRLADDLPPFSAETSRKSGALIYPELLGPPRPVAGDIYFTFKGERNLLGLVLSSLTRITVVVITTIIRIIATSSKTPHLGTNMSYGTVLPSLFVATY